MSQSIQIPVTQIGLEQSIVQGVRNASKKANFSLGGLGSGGAAQKINAISQPLGRITGQADEFSKSMAAANARVLAFGASAGIMAGVSAALAGVVKSAINVEQKLTSINTVLQTSAAQLEKFGDSIFDIAKNTGQSFDIVAEGALELARQGLSAADTLSRLNDALILSRLSGLDAAKSVEGLTAAYNSFQGAGETTATILNKLVVVSQKYAVSEKDLIEGVKRSASVADLAGVSFNELLGVITAVQQKTARGGAVIGNSFKTIFARIQDKGVLTDLQDLGVEVTDASEEILPATKILGNLAQKFGQLSKIQQTDLAKKLGGIYQLDKLLAGLEDLSSANSVARESAKLAAGAQNQAYEKNLLLNQTLAEVINRVTINAQELGAKLGALGVTDSLKNILSFFNNLLEGVQNLLGEESGLGKFVRGIVRGISEIVTGPGLALFAAIIVKLSKDLVVFGAQSLKSFFGIGKAAKDIKDLETSIKSALASNVDLQEQILKLGNDRYSQMKLITAEIQKQEVAQRTLQKISSDLSNPAYKIGIRAGEQGLRVNPPKNTAAEGYIPAVSQEKQNIRKGVGGAKSGDKPVTLENFNFGGGEKGSIVAHTGEYVVPNFGGSSGSAIFNRDMVRKMGLPSGARKINAAGGFIPNFAKVGDLVRNFPTTLLPKLKISKSSDKRLLEDDSVNLTGNIFQKMFIAKKQDEDNKTYEDRIRKQLGYTNSSSLFGKDNSAIDGFKNSNSFLEVKGGKYDDRDVKLKFLRASVENYGTGNPLDIWTKNKDNLSVLGLLVHNNEKEKYATGGRTPIKGDFKAVDKLRANKYGRPSRFAANGFIPNFAESYDKNRSLDKARAYFGKAKDTTIFQAFKNPNTPDSDLIAASEALAKRRDTAYKFNAEQFEFGSGMGIGLVSLQNNASGDKGMGTLTSNDPNIQSALTEIGVPNLAKIVESKFKEQNIDPKLFRGVKENVLQAKPNIAFDNIKIGSVDDLKGQSSSDTFKDFQQTVNRLFARPISDLGNELFGSALGNLPSGDVSDKYIFGKDVLGSIFESATQFYIKGAGNLPSFQEGEATRNQRFDFPMENAEEAKRLNNLFFKGGGVGIAEAKLTANSSTLNSIVSKGLNDKRVKDAMKKQIASGSKVSMAGGFIPIPANYEDDNIPSYVREDIEKSPSFERIKSLYGKFPDLRYQGRGAESFVLRKGGDVFKVPTFKYAKGNQIKEKIKAIKGMNWMAASNQLSSLAPNLEIFPPKTSGAIISQSFAGETVGNVIKDYKKANGIGSKTSQIFDQARKNNPKKPNWLQPLYVDAGSAHNFTFPENLSEVKKEYFNDPSTSVDEIFNKNKIGLIDLGVSKYYVDQLNQEAKTTNAAGGFIPNFADVILNKRGKNSTREITPKERVGGYHKSYLEYSKIPDNPDLLNLSTIKSYSKGHGLQMFNKLGTIARKSGRKVYSSMMIPQRSKLGDLSDKSSKEDILKAMYPQLLYRQRSKSKNTELEFLFKETAKTLSGKNIFDIVKNEFKRTSSKNLINAFRNDEITISEVIDNFAGGFIPNFANPLQAAVGREMAAGVPSSQIYVDKNSSLKNAMNPMGLMVANRRDEPAGGFQGINRARKEGADPMMYGAAGGFVPNFSVASRAREAERRAKASAATASNPAPAASATAPASTPNQSTAQTQGAVAAGAAVATAATATTNALSPLAVALNDFRTEVEKLIPSLNAQIQAGKITKQEAGQQIENLATSKLKGVGLTERGVQKQVGKAAEKLVPDAAPKAMSDFVGKLFLLQSVASGVSAAFSELGQAGENLGQGFTSLTAGALSFKEFFNMDRSTKAELAQGAAGRDLVKNVVSAKQPVDRQAALAALEAGIDAGQIGTPGKGSLSARLARQSASAPRAGANIASRALSATGRGASRGLLSVITKVGPLFGRMIPIVGQVITGFQIAGGILKMFGFDLNKFLIDGLTKFGQSLGILKTDAEKLSDSFRKNSQEIASSLNTGKVEKGTSAFQKTIGDALKKASEKEIALKLRDEKQKTDTENVSANYTNQLLEDEVFRKNKEFFAQRAGLSQEDLQKQFEKEGLGGLQKERTTYGPILQGTAYQGLSQPQAEAIATLEKDLIGQFSSTETQKAFGEAVASGDFKKQKLLIEQLSEEAEKKLTELGKSDDVKKLRTEIADSGDLNDAESLRKANQAINSLLKDSVKAEEVQKQLNLVDLQIAQQKLDNLIKYKTALLDIPSIRDNELSIEKELINTTDARKVSIERELTARKAVVDLTKQQSDAAYTFLKDQGAIQAILQKAGIDSATVESFGDLSDILNGVTDQIRLQGGYTEDVKQKTREILKERLNNTRAEERITALLDEQMDGLFKQQQIQLAIQDIELKRNSIFEARNALLKMENDQKLQAIDSAKEELSYQEKIQDLASRSFKTRADALKEVSPKSIQFDVEGLQNFRDRASAGLKNNNQQQSIFRDLQKDLLSTALEKNFTDLANEIEKATNLKGLEAIGRKLVEAEKEAAIEKLNAAFIEKESTFNTASAFREIVVNAAEQLARILDKDYQTPSEKIQKKQKELERAYSSGDKENISQQEAQLNSLLEQRKNSKTGLETLPKLKKDREAQELAIRSSSGFSEAILKVKQAFNSSSFASKDMLATLEELDFSFRAAAIKIEKNFAKLMLSFSNQIAQEERKNIGLAGRIERLGMVRDFETENKANYSNITDPQEYLKRQQSISLDYFNKIQALELEKANREIEIQFKTEQMNLENIKQLIFNTEALRQLRDELSKDPALKGTDVSAFTKPGSPTEGITSYYSRQEAGLRSSKFSMAGSSSSGSYSSSMITVPIYDDIKTATTKINQMQEAAKNVASKGGDFVTASQEAAKNLGIAGYDVNDVAKTILDLANKYANNTAQFEQAGKTYGLSQDLEEKRSKAGTFKQGVEEGFRDLNQRRAEFANQFGKEIPTMFADGLSNALNSAIEGAASLKDALRSAAYEFVKGINQRLMSNLVDNAVGGLGNLGFGMFQAKASGGMITGGSGSKDDVPAMLMGGEYVVNKKAVSKYGPKFLEAINSGTLNGYAKGGGVQKGPQGNFYTPGTFGQGSIEGKRNLLDFATQSGTSGQFDQMTNSAGYQSISLEPESSRLSVSGMRNSPQFEATQSAKQQAFDLYLQQYNAEREAKKQAKEQKKALTTQLIMLAGSAALGPVIKAAGSGFGAAFKGADGQGFMSQLGAGFKGALYGGNIGGQQVGGLSNLFSSAGKALSGDFTGASNQFKLSQISNSSQLADLYKSDKGFASYIDGMGGFNASGAPKVTSIISEARRSGYGKGTSINGNTLTKNEKLPGAPPEDFLSSNGRLRRLNKYEIGWTGRLGFSKQNNSMDSSPGFLPDKPNGNAIGGMIPSTSGIDTVPAMLSGGEFVMNRSAVQGIGASNLQSMNSGGTSITSEETSKELNEKLLAKLDELINSSGSAGNITINVAPSGQATQDNSQDPSAGRQQLARQIKDAVLQIINDEKRIGGTLRR